MRFALLLSALVAAGCAGSKPTNESTPAPEGKPADPPKVEPKAPVTISKKLPDTLKVTYQDQAADAWGAKLLDRDFDTSMRGARALREIGPEGLRFALEGIKSTDNGVRQRALLYAIKPADALEYREVFFPVLKEIVEKEKNRDVKCAAIALVGKAKFPESVAVLESALATETDKPTRNQLETSIEEAKAK